MVFPNSLTHITISPTQAYLILHSRTYPYITVHSCTYPYDISINFRINKDLYEKPPKHDWVERVVF